MPAGDPVYADEVEFSEQAPIGRCVATGTQALADNALTALTFSTEEFDSHSQHSTSVNTSRITPNVAGIYCFDGVAWFDGQITPALSDAAWRLNGVTMLPGAGGIVGFTTQFSLGHRVYVPMNGTTDYVEFMARQNSAGNDTTYFLSQLCSIIQWKRERALIT